MTSNFVTSVYHEPEIYVKVEQNTLPLKAANQEGAQDNLPQSKKDDWSWSTTVWNVIAIILCPSFIGCMMTALICNIMAYIDFRSGNYEEQQYKLKCSFWWTTLTFMVATLIAVIVIIVLFGIQRAQDWSSLPFGLATY